MIILNNLDDEPNTNNLANKNSAWILRIGNISLKSKWCLF